MRTETRAAPRGRVGWTDVGDQWVIPAMREFRLTAAASTEVDFALAGFPGAAAARAYSLHIEWRDPAEGDPVQSQRRYRAPVILAQTPLKTSHLKQYDASPGQARVSARRSATGEHASVALSSG